MTARGDTPPPARDRRRRPPPADGRRRRRAVVRRRRITAAAALVAVIAMLGVAVAAVLGAATHPRRGGGPDASTPRVSTATHSATTTGSRTATSTSAHRPPPVARPPYPVIRTAMTLIEPAAQSHEPADGPRSLPTVVRYPVLHAGVPGPPRPRPLIVFSQGFAESPESYAGLLHAWSAAGFVVADPTYPRTDPDAAGGLDESDIVNHPADLRFVIGALLHAAANRSSPLHGRIDPKAVAVIGQSDGGDVSLAVAENSCCRDPAVRAAVILSGAELASFGGEYFAAGHVPLLVTQGTADTINAPACSAQIYDAAPQPKYYLNLLGSEHLPPYQEAGPVRGGVARVVVAFLQAYLERQRSGLRRLTAHPVLPGGLRLSHGGQAPIPEGVCGGAP